MKRVQLHTPFLLLLLVLVVVVSCSCCCATTTTSSLSSTSLVGRDTINKISKYDGDDERKKKGKEEEETKNRQLSTTSAGDFEEVNRILQDVRIDLPSVTIARDSMTVQLSRIQCWDLQIQNIALDSSPRTPSGSSSSSSSETSIAVEITNLDMYCTARYDYDGWWFVGGTGNVDITSFGNDASIDGIVRSSASSSSHAYSQDPPNEILVTRCNPNIIINNMNFSNGGILGWILDMVEPLMRDAMEESAQQLVCSELRQAFDNAEQGILATVKAKFMEYDPSRLVIPNPVLVEEAYLESLPPSTNLLDYQDESTDAVRWFTKALDESMSFLMKVDIDPMTGQSDLKANILLREYVLDKDADGSYSISIDLDDRVLFDGHDIYTQTTITVSSAKLVGLDSLLYVSAFQKVGSHTLQNHLGWNNLGFIVDLTIDIKPSTLPDSVIDGNGSTNTKIREEIQIHVSIDDLQANIAVLAALNQDLLEQLKLGTLLRTSNIVPCLWSTVANIEPVTFAATAVNINTPTMEGFVSPGLDRLFHNVMDTGFFMYEQNMLEASPAFFHNTLRPMLDEQLLKFTQDLYGSSCPSPPIIDNNDNRLVDLRDLLLRPEQALEEGGAGSEPYGDLFSSFVMPTMREQFFRADYFNTKVVRPITKEQSGVEGRLAFPNWKLFDYYDVAASSFGGGSTLNLYQELEFTISNLRVNNLDIVAQDSIQFLDPTDWNQLYNAIALNDETSGRDLNITVSFLLWIRGDSPLAMSNQIDFSISIPRSSFTVEFLASLQENALMDFPLNDVTNIYCWLAALGGDGSSTSLDANVERRTMVEPLNLSALSLEISTFSLDSNCVSCSSPGGPFISEIIKDLEQFGLAFTFLDPMVNLFEEMAWQYWHNLDTDQLFRQAPAYCPHLPTYVPDAPELEIDWPELTGMASESTEALLALGMISFHSAIIVAAKNHILLAEDSSNGEGSSTSVPEIPSSVNAGGMVDWTNIIEDYGEWADFAFQEARAYLAEPIKEDKRVGGVTPRANELMREFVLDSDGGFTIALGDMELELFGAVFRFHSVKVYGLDSIADLDALRPLEPLILENRFKLDELDVYIHMTIKENNESQFEPIIMSYKIRDINAQLDIMFGLNLDKLGNVQLGSIFDLDNIIFCLFDGVDILDLSKFTFAAGSIDGPEINGYFSVGTGDSLRWMLESLLEKYRDDVVTAVPLFFDSTLRGILNANSLNFVQTMRNSCPTPTPYGSKGLVDVRDLLLSPISANLLGGKGTSPYGNLFRIIYDKLTEEIFKNSATNRPLLNDILQVLTQKQSNRTGSISMPGSVMDSFANIKIAGLDAIFGLTFSDVTVDNVDSLGDPLDLFRPTKGKPYVLNNTMSFGVDSKPLDLASKITLIFNDGAEVALRNELNLSLSLEHVVLFGSLLLKMAENALSTFPLRDITNYNCWLATLLSKSEDARADGEERGVDLIDYSYSIGNFSLNISCASCTSPDFDALLESLYIPENATELETLLAESIESLQGAEFVEVLLDQMVKDSAKQCPHRPEYDPEAEGSSLLESPAEALGIFAMTEPSEPSKYFTIANALMACLLLIIGMTSAFCVRRRNRKWVKSLDREGSLLLSQQQLKELRMQEMLNASTTAMICSQYVDKKVRYGVPIALIINLGLLLAGHLCVLSTVNIDASIAGEEISIENFLEFTFFGSTWETYQNGGKEMAILLWIFAGIWPYAKLLLSTLMWVLPPRHLSVKRRGQVLLWIDSLVKLSVIDIFTVLLGLAVLLVFIGGPDESYLGEGVMYSMKAIIVPHAGFYCLVIAQRMSRVSSRFFLEYHETIINGATKAYRSNSTQLNDDRSQSKIHFDSASDNEYEAQDRNITSNELNDRSSRRLMTTTLVDTEVSRVQINGSPLISNAIDYDSEESSVSLTREYDRREDSEESSASSRSDSNDSSSAHSIKEFRWGTIGVIFGFVTVLSIFIIGCIFAPSISLDASEFAGQVVESGMTYEQAVSQYGAFLVFSSILVKARFVLNTRGDYVGLGFLLAVFITSLAMVFIVHSYLFVKRKLKERRDGKKPKGPQYGHRGCGLPFYLRQYKWKYMEIYLIAIAIGIWQLGSISSYGIHLYCDVMRRIYDVLAFAGLVEDSSAQCTLIQTVLPGNIILLMLSLGTLVIVFIFQIKAQYKNNISNALRWIDDKDVPRLSLAWSKNKGQNSRYSHLLNSSGTWDESSSELEDYVLGSPQNGNLSRSSRVGLIGTGSAGSAESRMESMEQLPLHDQQRLSFRETRQHTGSNMADSSNTARNLLQAACEEIPHVHVVSSASSFQRGMRIPSNIQVVNDSGYDDDYYF